MSDPVHKTSKLMRYQAALLRILHGTYGADNAQLLTPAMMAGIANDALGIPNYDFADCGRARDEIMRRLHTECDSPDETRPYDAKLDELAKLPRGWDSYDAMPPRGDCLAKARELAARLPPGHWDIVPMSNGGIQIEQHCGGLDIELMIEGASPLKASVQCPHQTRSGLDCMLQAGHDGPHSYAAQAKDSP